jgi:hypothetical protein
MKFPWSRKRPEAAKKPLKILARAETPYDELERKRLIKTISMLQKGLLGKSPMGAEIAELRNASLAELSEKEQSIKLEMQLKFPPKEAEVYEEAIQAGIEPWGKPAEEIRREIAAKRREKESKWQLLVEREKAEKIRRITELQEEKLGRPLTQEEVSALAKKEPMELAEMSVREREQQILRKAAKYGIDTRGKTLSQIDLETWGKEIDEEELRKQTRKKQR